MPQSPLSDVPIGSADNRILSTATLINNRYKIVKNLGSGGMGNVYLVEDIVFESVRVALKQIHETKINPLTLRSFQNEFKAMTRLKHPNLVQVFDFGFDQQVQSYYFSLEYIDGYTLRDLHHELDTVNRDRVLDIFIDLCRAIAFMHSRNIVHRDINPNNIMCTKEGRVKVMDFGLVDIGMDIQQSKGTLAYMAPEVIRGTPDYRTDIFSLGLTFYSVLAGAPFYETDDIQEIVHLLCNRDIFNQFCSTRLTACAAVALLQPVFERMLAFDPQERFQSCTAIISALNSLRGTTIPFETAETREAYVLGAGFVGREHEINRLQELAQKEHSTVVWVQGDAGVGKSRLFYEFKNWCQLNTITFLEGTCYENVRKQFNPFLPILSQLLLFASQEHVDRYGPELKKILPDHSRLSGIGASEVREPRMEHEIVLQTIVQSIVACMSVYPSRCVLYLNDLHWSDEGSIEVLDALLKRLSTTAADTRAIHLYFSSRIEKSEALEQIKQEHTIEHIQLPAFDAAAIQLYMEAIFGNNCMGQYLTKSIDHFHEKVGGNPFFLQELIKLLITDEIIVRQEHSWDLIKPLDQVEIPDNLTEQVIARLSNLRVSDHEQRILRIMALVNRAITHQELNEICSISSDLPRRLEYIEVIRIRQTGPSVDYEIAHDLVREAIEEQITDRRAIHEQIGRGLEVVHAHELVSYAEELAYHFYTADNRGKALKYIRYALKETMKQYENNKSLLYIDMLLGLLHGDDIEEKLDLMNKKSNILCLCGKIKQALAVGEEAIQFAEYYRINSCAHAFVYYNMAIALGDIGKPNTEVIDCLEKALRIYETVGGLEGISDTHMRLAFAYYDEKDQNAVMDHLDKAMVIAESIQNKRNIANITCVMSQVHEERGEFRKALECITRAIQILDDEELKNRYYNTKKNMVLFIGLKGVFYSRLHEYTSALTCFDQEISMANTLGLTTLELYGLTSKAEVFFNLKQFHQAKQIGDMVQDHCNKTEMYHVWLMGSVVIARIEYALGNRQKGIQLLQDILDKAENKYDIAKLCYELWVMTREEVYRTRSLEIYRSITPKNKNWRYLKRQSDLEKNKPPDHIYPKTVIRNDPLRRFTRYNI